MKYIMLVGDGMADRPADFPGGRTPLVEAETPGMDEMAARGDAGLVATIPEGLEPGSDVANMALMGYDPKVYYSGRAPLEAAAMGIDLRPGQVAYRCNLVSLDAGPGGPLDPAARMKSYSAGHITTPEARELLLAVKAALDAPGVAFHPGVSYRHLLVLDDGPRDIRLTPPHNISGKAVGGSLPDGAGAARLLELMERAVPILAGQPVNACRAAEGKPIANSLWFWGAGSRPAMPAWREKYGLTGAVVTAVDLVRGLGRVAGLEVLDVPGATGYLDTNYEGKVAAALGALEKHDFVFLHVEAPDEAGHEGKHELKVQAIADFDRRVVRPVLAGLAKFPSWTAMVLPDHPTPLAIMTHSAEPVPFAILRSADRGAGSGRRYDETSLAGGLLVTGGETLMRRFLGERGRGQG